MSLNIRKLHDASEEDLASAALVLDRAFKHEFHLAALGNDRSLVIPMIRTFVDTALVGGGEIWIAEIPNHGIVGVAIWFGPKAKFLDSQVQREAGWNQMMHQIPESCVSWWAEFLDVYDRFTDRVFGPGLKLNSYHLQLFGVAPEHHRKGVACALVQAVEQIAEPQHLPMCVETTHPSVIAVYEKLGFHLVGTEMFKRADGSQGQMSALLKQL